MTGCKITILGKGDPPYRAVDDGTLINANLDEVVILEGGTSSGRASVALIAKLPDGKEVFIQTTGRMLDAIHGALAGARQRFGEAPA